MTPAAATLFLFLIRHLVKHRLRRSELRYDAAAVKDAVEDAKLTYQDALARAGVRVMAVKAGHLAGQIARYCIRNHIPPVNSCLVNGRTREVGDAYVGGDPRIDLMMCLAFPWTNTMIRAIDASIIRIPVFHDSFW
jgi:hypothetical protein